VEEAEKKQVRGVRIKKSVYWEKLQTDWTEVLKNVKLVRLETPIGEKKLK
jgi:IS4 transposase